MVALRDDGYSNDQVLQVLEHSESKAHGTVTSSIDNCLNGTIISHIVVDAVFIPWSILRVVLVLQYMPPVV